MFHADRRKYGRIDGETNRWIDGETDVTKLILFFAILRTGLKFGSNCPLLQISVVHDVVSLEIRLAVSKEPKSYLAFFSPQ